MTLTPTKESIPRKPLRLWPGVVAVALQWLTRFVVPAVTPDAVAIGVFGALIGGVAVLVWWLFFSRAPWSERLSAVVLMIVALFATSRIAHESIATGSMGMLLPILAIPVVSLALVVWAAASRRVSARYRTPTMIAIIMLSCGVWALVRTGGITGNFDSDLHWRWAKTPEEHLLSRTVPESAARASAPEVVEPSAKQKIAVKPDDGGKAPSRTASETTRTLPEWRGFRGPGRDGVVRGVRIATDWSQSPPVKLWRRPVGPAWSSFAVRDDLLYTQEQRGDDEVVACYKLATGDPVWMHRDAARFWESNGGAGPRATPTLGAGRVYTFGATGILNALDARDGAVIWSRNAASDTETKIPGWGFSGSPLLFDDIVIVAVGGQLAAYDHASGSPRWYGPRHGGSYSSPHLFTIDGVAQIVLMSGAGATSVAPADGKVLWEHPWSGFSSLQPAVAANGDVLISTSESAGGIGTRRLAVIRNPGGWNVNERWTSSGLKPYFNDFVVHKGHAFGFDGSILSCINLEDGKRKWKGGRYGHGQLVLLPDQDLLLVLSEQGEIALVNATPDQYTEVSKFMAIEGKTWNHPVLVGDVLLARNSEEMAAFRLSLAAR